jgi:hypothetical protein
MGDDLTTNNQELYIVEDTELVGIDTGILPSWMVDAQGYWTMGNEGEYDAWSWMDEDTRTPNEMLKAHLRELAIRCKSPYEDGFNAADAKRQIWQMKCWIEDIYANLPTFDEEKDWEKERIFDKLSEDPDGGKE